MCPSSVDNRPHLVLCVDDDPSMLALTKIVLELEGYWVLTASRGKEALEKFASQPIDAVVLDYELPTMNGAEVAREMKRLKPRVPKLLFTSHARIPADAVQTVEAFCTKGDGFHALVPQLEHLVVDSEFQYAAG